MIARVVCALVLLAVWTALAAAQSPVEVLDQSSLVPPGVDSIAGLVIDEEFSPGQTFASGVAGRLARIELGVYRSSAPVVAPLTVELVAVQGGLPNYSPAGTLASRVLPATAVPVISSFAEVSQPRVTLSVDFSADDIATTVGGMLAIVLRCDATRHLGYSWWLTNQGVSVYPGGRAATLQNGASAPQPTFEDAHFRTFVAIPEPASAVLVAIALVAMRRCPTSPKRGSTASDP